MSDNSIMGHYHLDLRVALLRIPATILDFVVCQDCLNYPCAARSMAFNRDDVDTRCRQVLNCRTQLLHIGD